ncbi:MAG: TetR/AcrR family transcriptional regulator [Actinobacteria bacterium]|nr:TetR/AcrR family transcriptional regulator [Actinomycetota bacterium]
MGDNHDVPARSAHGPAPRGAGRSYGGVPAEVRTAQRRDRFLDAGLELFGTRGYQATSVRAVCREAGLTERYFYESFANTEALLAGVYQRCTDSMHDEILVALAAAGGRSDTTAASLDRVVRATLEAFYSSVGDPRVLRVCWLEVLGVSPMVDSTYIAGIDRFAHLVMTVMAGTFDLDADDELRLVATGLVGGVIMTAIRWYLDGQTEPVSTLVEANAVVFLGVAHQLAARR